VHSLNVVRTTGHDDGVSGPGTAAPNFARTQALAMPPTSAVANHDHQARG
jgi:hypothetical protein